MKMLNLIFAIAILMTVGCAETTTKPDSKSATATAVLQVNYIAARTSNTLKVEDCPTGNTGWHKETLVEISRKADACALFKKIERLEQIANHIAKTFATEPWGAFYLSIAAEQRSDYARALWMAELAIKKSPKNSILYYQRGRIHWLLNEVALAISDYNESLKFNSKLADAHLILAQLAARNQDYKSAVKHYQAVVEVETDNHKAFAALAELFLKLNQVKDAIANYESAVNLSPRSIEYRLRLGAIYELNAKDYDQALSVYRKLKSMLAENRTPSTDTVTNDVVEKIKKLEALVAPAPKEEKKVTSAASAKKNAQVKK